MGSSFNLIRFSRVLKKSLFERPVHLFGLTLVILGIVLLIYLTCRDIMGYPITQVITFFLGLVGGGYFLSAAVFGQFSTYPRAANYLTLPASALEKWLSGIVIVFLLYIPFYFGFYRLMDSLLVEIYRINLDPKTLDYERFLEEAKVLNFDGINVHIIFKLSMNICAIMLLGSLYFNKMANIKVALVICVVLFGFLGLNYSLAKLFFNESIFTFPFLNLTVKTKETSLSVELPEQAKLIVSYFFFYALPLILLLISYIKFKEKEF